MSFFCSKTHTFHARNVPIVMLLGLHGHRGPLESVTVFLSNPWDMAAIVTFLVIFLGCTPPKLNMEPENKSLEKESPFRNHYFQVPC